VALVRRLLPIILAVVATTAVHAQTFEGYLRWTMSVKVNDPGLKEKLEEAKKFAKDPENQEAYRQLQEKLKDPEFKATLEENPKTKAEIGRFIQMMTMGSFEGRELGAMTVKLKGAASHVAVEGPMAPGTDRLQLAEGNEFYVINHKTKEFEKHILTDTATAVKDIVTKTAETADVFGFKCTKYIVESVTPKGRKSISNFWTTTEIRDVDPKWIIGPLAGKSMDISSSAIEGVPLKVESTIEGADIVMEIKEIERKEMPSSDFEIPAGYTERKKP
jgi:hypothetical protein